MLSCAVQSWELDSSLPLHLHMLSLHPELPVLETSDLDTPIELSACVSYSTTAAQAAYIVAASGLITLWHAFQR